MDLAERTGIEVSQWRKALKQFSADIHCCAVGIIKKVDYQKQTCSVQLAIRETVRINNKPENREIPIINDVPFFILSGGNYCITTPVEVEDECIVVFSDLCFDGWWQSGGIQNRMDFRRHDLSDAIALVGIRSQQKLIENYDDDGIKIRSLSEDNYIALKNDSVETKFGSSNIRLTSSGIELVINDNKIEISQEGIKMTVGSNTIELLSSKVNINGSEIVLGDGTPTKTTIDGKKFSLHTRTGVTTGSGNTGPVTS